MGLSSVLDTNIVLYHLAGKLDELLPTGDLHISIVTEIELFAFKSLTPTEKSAIQTFVAGVTVVDVDGRIKDGAIDMRLNGLRLPDAIIAATAKTLGADLLTNDAGLQKAPGLSVRSLRLK